MLPSNKNNKKENNKKPGTPKEKSKEKINNKDKLSQTISAKPTKPAAEEDPNSTKKPSLKLRKKKKKK